MFLSDYILVRHFILVELTGAIHSLAISAAPGQLGDGDSNCATTQQDVVAQ